MAWYIQQKIKELGPRKRNSSSYCETEEHAKLYMQTRPYYPEQLYTRILEFGDECGMGRELAVDVGCGAGWNTCKLSEMFDKVIGVDPCPDEWKNAKWQPMPSNVEYRTSSAENLAFLEDSSVDLLTAATALHYFEHAAFFAEAERVLKPGGVIAAWSYNYPEITGCQEAMPDYYLEIQEEDLKQYYTYFYQLCDNNYHDIHVPMQDHIRLDNAAHHHREASIKEIVALMKSYVPLQKYMKEHPQPQDQHVIEKLQNGLTDILQKKFPEKSIDSKHQISISFYMILARKMI